MKLLSYVLFVVFTPVLCWSQTVTYETIDYLSDTSYVNTITKKYGSRLGLKITNVNKKLVTINKTITQTSFNEEVPELFETFFKTSLPPESAPAAGLAPGDVDLFTESELASANISGELKRKLADLNKLRQQTANRVFENDQFLDAFIESYKNIKQVLQYHSGLVSIQNICDKRFNTLRDDVNLLTLTTFGSTEMAQADRELLKSKDYYQNRLILNRYIELLIENCDKSYDAVSGGYTPSSKNELIKNTDEFYKILPTLVKMLDESKGKNEHAINLTKKLNGEAKQSQLRGVVEDKLDRFSKVNLQKMKSDIDSFGSTGKKELMKDYGYFTESNWIYYVEPVTIEKDLNVLTVSIIPKEDLVCSPIARSYELRVRANSGLKVDFSTGLFGNFGGKNFIDQSYSYENIPDNDDEIKIVRNKSKNAVLPSVGALMHFYKRTGKDVNISGTFGLSTKDLERVNYHLGGSLIFGYAQRVILSLGTTLTKATLIDDKYEVGQIIKKDGSPDTIPTATFNRFGFFFAITYNLSAK